MSAEVVADEVPPEEDPPAAPEENEEAPPEEEAEVEEEEDPNAKKEPAVLTDASLTCLGRDLDQKALRVAMYLNVPTVTLVNIKIRAEENEQTSRDEGALMLLQWRKQKEGCKDKERISELERALKDCELPDHADAVATRHSENQQLTSDAFNFG